MNTPTVPKPRSASRNTTNQNSDIYRLGLWLVGACLMAIVMLVNWHSPSRTCGIAFGLLLVCLSGMVQACIQDLRHHRKD